MAQSLKMLYIISDFLYMAFLFSLTVTEKILPQKTQRHCLVCVTPILINIVANYFLRSKNFIRPSLLKNVLPPSRQKTLPQKTQRHSLVCIIQILINIVANHFCEAKLFPPSLLKNVLPPSRQKNITT